MNDDEEMSTGYAWLIGGLAWFWFGIPIGLMVIVGIRHFV